MASAGSFFTDTNHIGLPPLRTSPLHLAATRGDVRKVQQLLGAGVDADALGHADIDGSLSVLTPLLCAAGAGHPKVVKILLKAGANPCVQDPNDGTSVLYSAAMSGNLEITVMLLEARAIVDGTDHQGRTALFGAASEGHDKVVEALISAHATVDMADSACQTPLMMAAGHGHERCVQLLLQAGAKFSSVEFTALHYGAGSGSLAVVRTLLGWGADVNSIGRNPAGEEMGVSALHIAAQYKNIQVIKVLLDAGATIDCADSKGRTALFAAALEGHSTTVKLLLDAGSDPHIRDRDRATALMYAKDLPTVKLLLEAGVSVTSVDVDGNTALHHVGMRGGSSGMICAIFKAGANPALLNKAGQTAAQVGREKGHHDAATLLDMLAYKYKQGEEAKDKLETAAPSEEVIELESKMSSCVVSKTSSKVVVESLEPSHAAKEKRQHRSLRPCLNCQTLTHRRCARCRTAYICSHDCQVATLAEHRVECLAIYEQRGRAKAEPVTEGKQEESD